MQTITTQTDYTKTDLSFDSTKIEFALLLQTARNATKFSYWRMQSLHSQLLDASFAKDTTHMATIARDIAQTAADLSNSATCLDVLERSQERHEFSVLRDIPERKD